MSRASEALRDVGIFNPWLASEYARQRGGRGIYIDRRPAETGRASQSAAWQVIRPGFMTNSEGHWRDYGHKTFDVFRRNQDDAALEQAKAWAAEEFGISEWERVVGLGRAWFPKGDAAIIRRAPKS